MHEIAATVGSSAIILIGLIFGILFNQRALDKFESRVDLRFGQVDARFGQIDARFSQIDARLTKVEAAFDTVNARLDQMGSQIQHLSGRIDRVESDLQQFFRTQGMLEKAVEVLEKRS